jgi:hypothetical protein
VEKQGQSLKGPLALKIPNANGSNPKEAPNGQPSAFHRFVLVAAPFRRGPLPATPTAPARTDQGREICRAAQRCSHQKTGGQESPIITAASHYHAIRKIEAKLFANLRHVISKSL